MSLVIVPGSIGQDPVCRVKLVHPISCVAVVPLSLRDVINTEDLCEVDIIVAAYDLAKDGVGATDKSRDVGGVSGAGPRTAVDQLWISQ
jgi:hypothetical protein